METAQRLLPVLWSLSRKYTELQWIKEQSGYAILLDLPIPGEGSLRYSGKAGRRRI
jgi:hypothetical protein